MALAFAQPYTRTASVAKAIELPASVFAPSRPGLRGQSERRWTGCICLQPEVNLGAVMPVALDAKYNDKNHRKCRFRVGLGEPGC